MAALIQNTVKLFAGKINLLIVDDDASLRESLRDIFSTPLFNISAAANLSEAERMIAGSTDPWHCWIVDFDFLPQTSGIFYPVFNRI